VGSRESGRQIKGPREVLASILFAGSMIWIILCGGCKTIGSGGRLPMPGTLSGQGMELKDINGRLYDYLQILLWVGRNNYDNHDNYDRGGDQGEGSGLGSCKPGKCEPETENCNSGSCKPGKYKLAKGKPENRKSGNHKPKIESYRFGNGLLGNRRLCNYGYEPESCKPGMENRRPENDVAGSHKPRNHDPRNGDVENYGSELKNKEVGQRALDGCMEIVGLPDDNEMLLANNMDGEGVDRLVREAMELKARREKLVGRMGKDVALLEKRYASYESSHRTLRTLQVLTGW
jgi:hypothetical protein